MQSDSIDQNLLLRENSNSSTSSAVEMSTENNFERAPLSPNTSNSKGNNNNSNEAVSESISYQSAEDAIPNTRQSQTRKSVRASFASTSSRREAIDVEEHEQRYEMGGGNDVLTSLPGGKDPELAQDSRASLAGSDDSNASPYSPPLSYPSGSPQEIIEGGKTSMKLTVLLLVNNVIGGGVLSLCTAFHQTSIILGIILLLGTTCLTVLNLVFIVDSATSTNCFRYVVLLKTYLPNWMANVTLISLIIWPLGTCVAYSNILSHAMPPVMEAFGADPGDFITGKVAWLLIGGIIFFAVSCRRHLADLLLPSIIGLVCIIFSAFAIMIRCFDGSYASGGKFAPANYTTLTSDIEPAYVRSSLLVALPVFAFALNVHSNAPHYYLHLKLKPDAEGKLRRSPKKMFKAIMYSHAIIIAMYLVFSILGVITFQNDSDRIDAMGGDILNGYANDDYLMTAVRFAYAIVILVSFPILHMAARVGLNQFIVGEKHAEMPLFPWLALETFGIVVFSSIVAGLVPSLDVTLAILGSCVGTICMFISPSFLYLYCCVKPGDGYHWKRVMAYFCIGFGVVVPGILGLLATFHAI